MTNDQDDLRDHLTFSQRYGYEPLPEPMKLEELSDNLRREIWNEIRELLLSKRSRDLYDEPCFVGEEERFIERVVGKNEKIAASEVPTEYYTVERYFSNLCSNGKFNVLLDSLEIVMNDRSEQGAFSEAVRNLFETYSGCESRMALIAGASFIEFRQRWR